MANTKSYHFTDSISKKQMESLVEKLDQLGVRFGVSGICPADRYPTLHQVRLDESPVSPIYVLMYSEYESRIVLFDVAAQAESYKNTILSDSEEIHYDDLLTNTQKYVDDVVGSAEALDNKSFQPGYIKFDHLLHVDHYVNLINQLIKAGASPMDAPAAMKGKTDHKFSYFLREESINFIGIRQIGNRFHTMMINNRDGFLSYEKELDMTFEEYYNAVSDMNTKGQKLVELFGKEGNQSYKDPYESCSYSILNQNETVLPYAHKNMSNKIENYLTDMLEQADNGKFSKVVGRDIELEMVINSLSRYRKGNPVLVGESGVGKTAIVEGLAYLIANDDKSLPKAVRGMEMYSMEVGTVMAGTKYRGELEERVVDIFKELSKKENAILFIDEIHMIQNGKESVNIGNMMKTYLTKGNLRVVGSTTYKEYTNIFEKDPALPRRFQKIEVVEPDEAETVEILKGLRKEYEDYHDVAYSNSIIDEIVSLSGKYLTTAKFPDKAIDVMDVCGTKVKLRGQMQVTSEDVAEVIGKMARIPVDTIGKKTDTIANLAESLGAKVFGQDAAIEKTVKLIKISKAGLGDDHKPIASLLYTGPSGTGKTYLTKQLADAMGVKVFRFDMSEYSDRTSSNKLIGASAGFVGYEEGGLLTETVIKNPNCVILLDEIEKAHPQIFTLLLQVMDDGKLTDSRGRVADFRNVVLVMTSNTGARAVQETKGSIGFHSGTDEKKADVQEDVMKEMFSPEFRNRLDAVCTFKDLTESSLEAIVTALCGDLEEKMNERIADVKLALSEPAMNYFVKNGYEPGMGARPMKRLIAEKLKMPISELILEGGIDNGACVVVTCSTSNEIMIDVMED